MLLLKWLESLRTPWLDQIMLTVTELGSDTVMMVVSLAVMWCVSKRWGMRMLLVGLTGTTLSQLLKAIFVVPRPWVADPSLTIVEAAREGASGYSFPSGHTQSAASVFTTLAMWLKGRTAAILCGAAILLTGFSRMYLGVHTPLDVGVGLIVGVGLTAVMIRLLRRFRHNRRATGLIYLCAAALCAGSLLYLALAPANPRSMPETDAENIGNMAKLLGALLGLTLAWQLDERRTHFSVKAPAWGQLIKLLGGLALVLGVQTLLKPALAFLPDPLAHGLRYFLMSFLGCGVWPMTFRFYQHFLPSGKTI